MTDEITWALCSWFEESGEHLIHPDDLDRIRRFNPFGVVFTVLTNDGEYTEIGAGAEKFRVRPETLRLIKPRESWIFELGEGVAIKGRNYNGTVVGIGWHHKEEKPTYRLKVAGKIKSKRYWPDDLQRLHLGCVDKRDSRGTLIVIQAGTCDGDQLGTRPDVGRGMGVSRALHFGHPRP